MSWLGGATHILVLVSPDGRYFALSGWFVQYPERALHPVGNRNDRRGENSVGSGDCGVHPIEVPPFTMGSGKHLCCPRGDSSPLLPA